MRPVAIGSIIFTRQENITGASCQGATLAFRISGSLEESLPGNKFRDVYF